MRKQCWIERHPTSSQFSDRSAEIAAIEQDNRGGNEIEGRRPHLLIFEATIPEASQPMESNCARQAVAGSSFVEFAGDELAERRVLEPLQCEQCAFDAADFVQRGSEAVLLR